MNQSEYPVSEYAQTLLDGKSIWREYNGISHATVTEPAHRSLMAALRSYGNQPSEDHTRALYLLLAHFTEVAQGRRRGRSTWPLATGLGKTSAIRHWVASMVQATRNKGNEHRVTLAVSASKVEALCDLKREMVRLGVPEEFIGLSHSYRFDPQKAGDDGYASMPATPDNHKKQILLITHAKTKGKSNDLPQLLEYRGRKRSLLVWDESLIVSDHRGMDVQTLKEIAAAAKAGYDVYPTRRALVDWIVECERVVLQALEENREVTVRLPEVSATELADWRMLAATVRFHSGPIEQLLDMACEQVRVTRHGARGVLWYDYTLPEGLPDVTVLDASYPVRQLAQADKATRDGSKYCAGKLSVPLESIKRFDNVEIRHMKAAGGREALTQDTLKGYESKAMKDVADVVSEIPTNEAVLIFTYKTRPGQPSFVKTLEKRLVTRGVDLNAKVDGKPRVNIATWGSETSSNEWSHCKHVILAGVLEQPVLALAAAYCGQQDDLEADLGNGKIHDLASSECAHMVYQALSRGASRVVENGQAGASTVWVITKRNLKAHLESVLPGAKWLPWDGDYNAPKAPKIDGVTTTVGVSIRRYLDGVDLKTTSISTSKLKKVTHNENTARTTWQVALRSALGNSGWVLVERSVVRKDYAESFEEPDEDAPKPEEEPKGIKGWLKGLTK